VLEQLEHAHVAVTVAPPERDTASGFRAILAGDCVALAPDMVSEHAIPGLAVRPVLDPIRYPWTVSRVRSRPAPAADAFVAWALSGEAERIAAPASGKPPARA